MWMWIGRNRRAKSLDLAANWEIIKYSKVKYGGNLVLAEVLAFYFMLLKISYSPADHEPSGSRSWTNTEYLLPHTTLPQGTAVPEDFPRLCLANGLNSQSEKSLGWYERAVFKLRSAGSLTNLEFSIKVNCGASMALKELAKHLITSIPAWRSQNGSWVECGLSLGREGQGNQTAGSEVAFCHIPLDCSSAEIVTLIVG